MFVSPAFAKAVFFRKEDRRRRRRFTYPAVVNIDGRPLPGRDISPKGLSVLLPVPAIGDIVRVTLAAGADGAEEISGRARVVRVGTEADGFVVGLEFIE
jgi:PilZ domain